MIVKTNAIVLRARKLRETSRFLTLYTEKFGKIDAVAKGVRVQKSKLRGVLEPFNEISAVIYRKENRGAQYLSDAEVVSARKHLTTDYERLSGAWAIAELADAVMHHEETNPRMYALLAASMTAIDDPERGPGSVVLEFQYALIHVLGFGIQAQSCSGCGRDLASAAERWFSPADGGYRCGACGRGDTPGTKISANAYNMLISFASGQPQQRTGPTPESIRAEAELRGLLNAYILHHTESRMVLRAGAMFAKSAGGL